MTSGLTVTTIGMNEFMRASRPIRVRDPRPLAGGQDRKEGIVRAAPGADDVPGARPEQMY